MTSELRPHKGAQEAFCRRSEFEALYGGAAGPGKTSCLVALASRQVDKPGYKAILFRRTFPRLQEIMDRCWEYYPTIGGVWRATEHRWYFPGGDASGAVKPFIQLGHLQHEESKRDYQGKEFAWLQTRQLSLRTVEIILFYEIWTYLILVKNIMIINLI